MLKMLAAMLVTFASGASFAQMMGSPISTTQYFPLVDGARYDYVFVSGSRMTATAVMHADQTWGGVSGLTGVRSHDVHLHAGDGDTPAGDHFMMTYSSPEWMLKNPVSRPQ